jgi:5-methylcytosine-specific restriction endonuclease McrA
MDCLHQNKKYIPRPNTPHHAEIRRADCNKFLGWQPAPNHEGIRRESTKHDIDQLMQHKKFVGEPFCFFCLRTKKQLGISETLTIDHIVPVRDKGENDLVNLQLHCTACHKLRHWAELYMNKHYKGEEK